MRCHDEQPEEEVHPLPDWFQQPKRLPSPDHAWNKFVPVVHESVQPWAKAICNETRPLESPFDDANIHNILTSQHLSTSTNRKIGLGSTSKPPYPHDLRKPLPLVPNSQGRHVIPFYHFINNNLEYLRGGESSRKYSTSVMKTKAADYGHIKWIEDLGKKRRQFYAFAAIRESARNVYSKRRIIAVTKVEIVEWKNYKHLDWITVRRDDDIRLQVSKKIQYYSWKSCQEDSSKYESILITVDPHGFQGYPTKTWAKDKALMRPHRLYWLTVIYVAIKDVVEIPDSS
ncbi:hypothetical protein Tco_1121715 [Tanacetum coccineum]|uniref:Uncharacterized protein n=1 Tax=Tanacetum coccineum TaxID=301880 RepID=A0ABQ5J003_9ASTR